MKSSLPLLNLSICTVKKILDEIWGFFLSSIMPKSPLLEYSLNITWALSHQNLCHFMFLFPITDYFFSLKTNKTVFKGFSRKNYLLKLISDLNGDAIKDWFISRTYHLFCRHLLLHQFFYLLWSNLLTY